MAENMDNNTNLEQFRNNAKNEISGALSNKLDDTAEKLTALKEYIEATKIKTQETQQSESVNRIEELISFKDYVNNLQIVDGVDSSDKNEILISIQNEITQIQNTVAQETINSGQSPSFLYAKEYENREPGKKPSWFETFL